MARGQKKKTQKGSAGLNRKQTDAFLAKNAHRPEVVETSSGLQYEVLVQGEGDCPTSDCDVVVNQRITLIDGTVIADTYRTGEKDIFSVTEAVEGLQEGLLLMPVGARYKFYVGPDLAWGKRGAGTKIGPYATVIYDIRLEEIRPSDW